MFIICFQICFLLPRASLSCSTTQCIFCLRSLGLSFTCCEENRPFFKIITLTDNNATAIAIINMLMMKVSIIFLIFACKDNANHVKRKIKANEMNFLFLYLFRHVDLMDIRNTMKCKITTNK